MSGKVFLIGGGPGDPGLITLRAIECLRKSSVVIYDYLVNEQLIDFVPPDAEKIYVGKKSDEHTYSQEEINELLIMKAKEGKTIARLKGGDPFLFGRGGEEAEALAEAAISFEVIPGITSAIAAPAYAGIPVTHRDLASSVHIITGHEKEGKTTPKINYSLLAQLEGTLVFLMGISNLENIVSGLLLNDKNPKTPIAIIRWGTYKEQETIVSTLDNVVKDVKEHNMSPPGIIVIGDVVNLRKKIFWFEKKPLFRKRFAVTRPEHQGAEFIEALENLGAEVYNCPTIKICPIESSSIIDNEINQLNAYQWLIFTSVNSVRIFMERVFELGKDSRALGNLKICTIGSKTGDSLMEYGIIPDLIPDEFSQEGILKEIKIKKNDKVLLPRAASARDLLPLKLEEMGAIVEVVPLYETIADKAGIKKLRDLLLTNMVDVITFTSSSSVTTLLQTMDESTRKKTFKDVVVASIGSITSRTLRSEGIRVDVEAKEYTTKGLTKAILEFYHVSTSH